MIRIELRIARDNGPCAFPIAGSPLTLFDTSVGIPPGRARIPNQTQMKFSIVLLLSLITVPSLALGAADETGPEVKAVKSDLYWPQWRGPLATGAAPYADPPIHWSESENIRWKITLPGLGHSTPIVWGDRVFLTAAVPFGEPVKPSTVRAPGEHDNLPVTRRHKFVVLAIDRSDGAIVWRKSLASELPLEGGHVTGSLASNSPTTDGERLFAFFGSRGLYCLSLDGDLIWTLDLGNMRTLHAHGEGSSPVLHGNTLVINWDHEGESFVVAVDTRTGVERWRVARDEVTSWSTPLIVQVGGKPQVVISATGNVRGYDLATGKVIWRCSGLSRNVVASPVASDSMVFVTSSYDFGAMLAIRLRGASGDLSGSDHLVWTRNRNTPYVSSPLLYEGSLYFLRHNQGVLSRLVAESGEEPSGPFRLDGIGEVFASPVAAAGRIYITDLDGTTLVISADPTPDVLGLNHLDESFSASPALVDRELYLRGAKSLYCVAEE